MPARAEAPMKLELTDSSCARGDRVWQQEARCHEGAAGGWAPCSHSGTSRGLSSTTDRVQGEAPRSRTRAVCLRDRNRRIDRLIARLAHVPRACASGALRLSHALVDARHKWVYTAQIGRASCRERV